MPFSHSTSSCMKSLMIICSKLAKVTPKQCSEAILISQFFLVKLFRVIHSVKRKISWNFFRMFLFNKWKIWWMLSSFWRTTCRDARLIIVVILVKIAQTKYFLCLLLTQKALQLPFCFFFFLSFSSHFLDGLPKAS